MEYARQLIPCSVSMSFDLYLRLTRLYHKFDRGGTRHSRRKNDKKSRANILYFFQHNPATEQAIRKLGGEQAPDSTYVEFILRAWNTE